MAHQACLLLGSNIEPEQNIPRAITLLSSRMPVLQLSSVWESASTDCCYPNFLNVAVLVETLLDADDLKQQVLRPLEDQMGRVRTEDKNASRTIDFDIILFDGRIVDPTLWEYVHRAVPVAEIFPDLRSDSGHVLAEVGKQLAQSTPIKFRPDILIPPPKPQGMPG